ncbi:Rho-type gtpase-activating protein [Polyrhizophydium stewartii]|uniref:Rho-type gtpase-activating protein n=1 Tax=Polyrhizophydium stewartii TaxID=2732419 RepID=A0ABR4N527_9FUNG
MSVSGCAECGIAFDAGEVITCGDSYFHPACFACSSCRRPLSPSGETILLSDSGKCKSAIENLMFAMIGNGLYCVPCYHIQKRAAAAAAAVASNLIAYKEGHSRSSPSAASPRYASESPSSYSSASPSTQKPPSAPPPTVKVSPESPAEDPSAAASSSAPRGILVSTESRRSLAVPDSSESSLGSGGGRTASSPLGGRPSIRFAPVEDNSELSSERMHNDETALDSGHQQRRGMTSSFSFESNASQHRFNAEFKDMGSDSSLGPLSHSGGLNEAGQDKSSSEIATAFGEDGRARLMPSASTLGSFPPQSNSDLQHDDVSSEHAMVVDLQETIQRQRERLHAEVQARQSAEAKVLSMAAEIEKLRGIIIRNKFVELLEKQTAELLIQRAALKEQVSDMRMQTEVLEQGVQQSINKYINLIKSLENGDKQRDANATAARAESEILLETFQQDLTNIQLYRDDLAAEILKLKSQRQSLQRDLEDVSEQILALDLPSVVAGLHLAPPTSPGALSSPANTASPLSATDSLFRSPTTPSNRSSMKPFGRSATEYEKDYGVSGTTPKDSISPASSDAPGRPRRERSKTISGKASEAGRETMKWAKELKNNIVKAAGGHSTRKQAAAESSDALNSATMSGSLLPSGSTGLSVASLVYKNKTATEIGRESAMPSASTMRIDREAERDRPYHRFLPHSYISPKKCDFCNEKLWGKELRLRIPLPQQVLLKRDRRLLDLAPVSLVFGVELSKLLKLEGTEIPNFVVKCINFVECKGMEYEGIYRKSGPVTQINRIISAINRGEDVNFEDESNYVDVTAVTSALKQYLRELPDSLISSQMYREFVDAARNLAGDARDSALKSLVTGLPKDHVATLGFLIQHLHRVQQKAAVNLMNASNIGVVFGPTLLKPVVPSTQLDLVDAGAKSTVVELLVAGAPMFFPS